jgi:6,7-dimethyl-8-ribityllumazine synthase
MPKYIEGRLIGQGLKVALVVSRFNSFISEELLTGAIDALVRHGVLEADIEVIRVPGCFELPQIARRVALSGRFDALVALGAVIRGGTAHYEHIATEVTKGVAQIALGRPAPSLLAMLTCDTWSRRSGVPGPRPVTGRRKRPCQP